MSILLPLSRMLDGFTTFSDVMKGTIVGCGESLVCFAVGNFLAKQQVKEQIYRFRKMVQMKRTRTVYEDDSTTSHLQLSN